MPEIYHRIQTVQLVTCGSKDSHLEQAARYAQDASDLIEEDRGITCVLLDSHEESVVNLESVDVICFFTHGCNGSALTHNCPSVCGPATGDRNCFRGASDTVSVVTTLHTAAKTARLGIYAATTCYTGLECRRHLVGMNRALIGYSADFRHVLVPVGVIDPFREVVLAPFTAHRDTASLERWYTDITLKYAQWLGSGRSVGNNDWYAENWWVIKACLRHNRRHLVFYKEEQ